MGVFSLSFLPDISLSVPLTAIPGAKDMKVKSKLKYKKITAVLIKKSREKILIRTTDIYIKFTKMLSILQNSLDFGLVS